MTVYLLFPAEYLHKQRASYSRNNTLNNSEHEPRYRLLYSCVFIVIDHFCLRSISTNGESQYRADVELIFQRSSVYCIYNLWKIHFATVTIEKDCQSGLIEKIIFPLMLLLISNGNISRDKCATMCNAIYKLWQKQIRCSQCRASEKRKSYNSIRPLFVFISTIDLLVQR